MENPYSDGHFLKTYWCIKPAIIDHDRRDNGDYFKKPTQYWFLNCTPEQNVIFEALPMNIIEGNIMHLCKSAFEHTNAKDRKTMRSMIHPDYANRFIRTYLLKEESHGENTV